MKAGSFIGYIVQVSLFLSGCTAFGGTPFQYKPVYSSTQCETMGSDPDIRLIKNTREWSAFFNKHLNGRQLPPPVLPNVDFSDAVLLIVYAGVKPTTGYRVFADEEKIKIKDGILEIVIDIQTPPPGRMQAQMLTAPCLILRIPSKGYQKINITDSAGRLFAEKKMK